MALPGLALGLNALPVFAAPQGGQVVGGTGGIDQSAANLTVVNQASNRLAIEWQSFNINRSETVQFNQPGVNAAALNRILDQNPSAIFGQVKANGQVFLMNPNGVFFGRTARVDVGGLVAGGMDISVQDFMSGNYKLQAIDGKKGRVVNRGEIIGDEVALVGKSVSNEGVILATAGRVSLVAGNAATVDFDGDGLLRFTVDEAVIEQAEALSLTDSDGNPIDDGPVTDQVSNTGTINADGGDILISASATDGIFNNLINNQGVMTAARIDNSGGTIRLVATGTNNSVINTGTMTAAAGDAPSDGGTISIAAANFENTGAVKADARDGDGGTIAINVEKFNRHADDAVVSATSTDGGEGGYVELTGETIALEDQTLVDVSGASGGGTALIGGDYRGENENVDNAEITFVASDASVKADAVETGDGGKVVLWADDTTYFYGDISADGGATSGDGGFVEVSGKETLVFKGNVTTDATNGETGQLLLDPGTLTVIDAAAGGDQDTELTVTATIGEVLSGVADVGGNTISWGAIDSLLDTVSITLEATGLITINDVTGAAGGVITTADLVTLDLSANSLTITSTTANVVFTDANDVIRTEGGAITINAAGGTSALGGFNTTGGGGGQSGAVTLNIAAGSFGDVTTGGSDFTVNSAGAVTQVAGKTIQGASALVKQGTGTLTLDQANTFTGTTTISAGTIALANSGGLGSDTGNTIINGGTLELQVDITSGEDFNIQGAGVGSAGAITAEGGAARSLATGTTVTLEGNATIGGSQNLTITDAVVENVGPFGLTKAGAGTLTMSAAATYTGATSVTAGTLAAGSGAADVIATSSGLDVSALATFDLGDTDQNVVALTGAGNVTNSLAAANLDVTGTGTGTFSGIIADGTGALSLTKSGAGGTLTLSGANTYTGVTNVSGAGGTLVAADASALGTAAAGTTVASGAALETTFITGTSSEAIAITGTGVGGTGALRVNNASGTATLNGVVSGAGSVRKEGAGTFVLGGTNTYTGVTEINAGTLQVAGGDGIGDTSAVTISATGTLDLNGTNETIGSLASSAAGASVTLGAGTLTTGGNNTSTSFDGVISGTGGLTKVGTMTFTLAQAATYTGNTVVSAGTLQAGAADVIATSASLDLDGGTFDLNGNDQNVAALLDTTGTGTVTSSIAGAANLDVTGTATNAFDGIIQDGSGTVSLTKSGVGGTLTLSGANTYSGVTTVTGGTLAVANAAGLGAATGNTVVNGGTVELQVDIANGEDFNIQGAGVSSAGAITAEGGAARSLGAGSVVTLEGNATIGGTQNLTITDAVGQNVGPFALTKVGAGVLTLSAASTYTGNTIVSAGTLRAGAADVIATSALLDLDGGTFDLNGFDQNVIALIDTTSTGTVTNNAVATAANLDVTGTGTNTFDGVIQDGTSAVSLTKSGGGGTLTLAGANTYTGVTTVTGGTVAVANATGLGDATGNTVVNGGTVELQADIANGEDFNIQGAGVGSAGAITAEGGAARSLGAGTVVTLEADASIGGTQNLTITEAVGQNVGPFGLTKVGAGVLTLSAAATYTGNTVVSAGTLSAGVADVIATSALLDLDGGTFDLNGNDQNIIALTDTTGTGTVTSGVVGAVNVDVTGTGTNTFDGVIQDGSGTVSLTKSGAGGTLTLAGANTFTGATTISGAGGTLQAGAANVLQNSSGLDVGAGTTFDTNGAIQTVVALTGDGTVESSAGLGTLIHTGTSTFAGTLQNGAGQLRINKGTGGTFTLTGNNTYTGPTQISGGILQAGSVNAIGDTSQVNMGGGATLDLNGFDQTIGALISGSATASVTLGSGTLTYGDATASLSYAGTITGTGGIIKQGSGTSVFTNTGNAYTGATTVTAGTLQLGAAGVIADGSALVVNTGGTFDLNDFNETVASLAGTGGTVDLGSATLTYGDANNLTYAGAIIGTGGITKQGVGISTLSGANTFTGNTVVSAGTLAAGILNAISTSALLDLDGGTFDLNGFDQDVIALTDTTGTGTVTSGIAGAVNLDVTGTGTNTFDGVIEDGTGTVSLTKSGAGGTLTLAGTNTYTGATNVSGVGATLVASNASALGTAAAGTTVVSGAALEMTFTSGTSSEAVSIAGTGVGGTGALRLNNASGTGTLTGAVTGAGSVRKEGAGTFVLGGANTYSGVTEVNAGELEAGSTTAIGDTSAVTVAAGAVLDLNGNNETIGSLAGATGASVTLGAGTLTTGGDGTSTTYSGTISGTGGLTKVGGGTFILDNTGNAYTGATTVTAGTLQLGAAGVIADGSALVVNSGTFDLNDFNETVASLAGAGGTVDLGSATLIYGDANNLSYAGAIIGTGGITKQGVGISTLNGANTYTGNTVVSAGTLAAGILNAISTSALLDLDGGTFDLNGFDQDVIALTDTTGTGTVTSGIAGAVNLDVTGTGTNTFDGGIENGTGTVSLTKSGAGGTLTLANNNTYTGVTSITGGTLRITNIGALGDATGNTVVNGGTLDVGVTGTLAEVLNIQGTGANGGSGGALDASVSGVVLDSAASPLTLDGAATIRTADSVILAISDVIAGAFDLSLGTAGPGTVDGTINLNAANTYTGQTNVAADTIVVANDVSALGAGAGATVVDGTLRLSNGGGDVTFDEVITLNASSFLAASGAGTTRVDSAAGNFTLAGDANLNGGTGTLSIQDVMIGAGGFSTSIGTVALTQANTFNGNILMQGGSTLQIANAAALGNNTGTTTLTGATLEFVSGAGLAGTTIDEVILLGNSGGFDSRILQNDGTGTVTIDHSGAGVFSLIDPDGVLEAVAGGTLQIDDVVNGAGGFDKRGAGVAVLTQANGYTGATVVTAGTLRVTNATGLGTSGGGVGVNGTSVTSGATLELNNINGTVTEEIAIAGTGVSSAGALRVDTVAGATTTTLNGVISGTGDVRKVSAGTLALGGVNTYTGVTNIDGGTVQVTDAAGLGSSGGGLGTDGTTVANGATLDFALGGGSSGEELSISGAGDGVAGALKASSNSTLTGTVVMAANSTVDVDTGITLMLNGVVSGAFNLTKQDAGILVLGGTNTYTGNTVVSAGTLRAGAADVIAASALLDL
ncbi:MAG: autotransporter-associated beta strand repeat-containing protein, partial [Pseudomonadota bacterium]